MLYYHFVIEPVEFEAIHNTPSTSSTKYNWTNCTTADLKSKSSLTVTSDSAAGMNFYFNIVYSENSWYK